MSLDIIIPCVDERLDLIKLCLQNLKPLLSGTTVIIVAGASPKLAAWVRRQHDPQIKCLTSKESFTFARGNNLASELLQADHICLLNNDVFIKSEALGLMQADAIVGCKLLYPNRLIQHAGIGFDIGGNPYHAWRFAPECHPEIVQSRRVPAVTFACAVMPRLVWANLGGLDEGFNNAYEDVDFCLRAMEENIPIWYQSNSVGVHLAHATASRHDQEHSQNVDKSWKYFSEKWIDTGRFYKAMGFWPLER